MIYAKLDVDVYCHPKFIKAGFEASGYWMHALAYLRRHESSDGFLADDFIGVPLCAGKEECRRLCERLVSAGLFGKVEGGYVLLRYAEKNETKEDILRAKAAAKERKTRSRRRPEPSSPPDLSSRSASVARYRVGDQNASVTRDCLGSGNASVTPSVTRSGDGLARVPPGSGSGSRIGSRLGSEIEIGSGGEGGAGGTGSGAAAEPLRTRPPLPQSERALSGPLWLEAFTRGVTSQTGRPCTAGRVYLGTLERIVEHHAPARDAGSASAWLREEAAAFAAKWDGKHPPKGLTPDGLERWLNEGRLGPPQFGKPRIVQLPAEQWKPDDYSDLGAVMITGDGSSDGKANSHE